MLIGVSLLIGALIAACNAVITPYASGTHYFGDSIDTTAVTLGATFSPDQGGGGAPGPRTFREPDAATGLLPPAPPPSTGYQSDWPAQPSSTYRQVATSTGQSAGDTVEIETEYGTVTLSATLGAILMAVAFVIHKKFGPKA